MPAALALAALLTFAALSAGLAAPADTGARPDSGFTVERLAEGVYAVVRREPPAVVNESNSLFIVGDEDVIVVDAQSSLARTRETLAALRAITPRPVRAVIATHWHDDHVFGTTVWRDSFPAVQLVAHETAAEELATTGARFRASFDEARAGTRAFLLDLVAAGRSYAGGPLSAEERLSHLAAARLVEDYGAPGAHAPPAPTTLVRDRLVLRQGSREIEVLHLGRGHTRGDLVVHLPAEGIVAAGDLVMWPITFVGTTSYPPDFAVTLDRLRALRPRTIVPGHGPVLRGDAHVALVSRMLHALTAQVRTAAAGGAPLDSVRARVDLSAFERALAGESPVRRILFGYYVTTPAVQRTYELVTGGGTGR